MVSVSSYDSPLGRMVLSGSGEALTGLWFEGQLYFGSTLPQQYEQQDLPVFQQARRWLDLYFSGTAPSFTPPLSLSSTPFRQAVWNLLLTIPFGQTRTYGEIAAQLAKQKGLRSMSAQAVGGAVGHNPISLIIPCHRVIGSRGSLTGYAGGIQRKARLLALEQPGSAFLSGADRP